VVGCCMVIKNVVFLNLFMLFAKQSSVLLNEQAKSNRRISQPPMGDFSTKI
jgi:hypothetical protein